MAHMRWLVGFDLTPNSVGAVRMARWLHARSHRAHVVQGVSVVTSAATGLHNTLGSGASLDTAHQQTLAFLERHEVAGAFQGVETLLGAPDKVLHGLVKERRYDALLLGRTARTDEFSLVSLGRVPRRLLRRLELPTVIVPPDHAEQDLGRGPLLVGVTPFPDCLEAVRFALRLGEQLSLPVMLVHAIPREQPVAVLGPLAVEPRDPTMATPDLAPLQDTTRSEAAIEQWTVQHGLQELPLELRRGSVPAALRDAGREHQATMIVCGSRQLSLVERLFNSSVGSDLAGHADRPVAVVPSMTHSP